MAGRAICFLTLLALAPACRPAPPPSVTRAWEVMGTVFTAAAWGPDTARLARALGRAHDSLRLVDSLLSTFRDDSEISRVNRGAGSREQSLSPTFAAVLAEALAVAAATNGAFDPTLRDYRGVRFDSARGTVRLRRGLALDFGGIAKGYGLDRAALALVGVADSAILSLGGQLLLLNAGGRPGVRERRGATGPGAGRAVGIPDPDNPLDLAAIVEAPPGTWSVSTSPQAEEPGHIVDPRTGRAAARVRWVTVVAPSAMAADAWSTALFVLGCDSALALAAARRLPGAGAGVVCADSVVRWTPELDGRVLPTTDPAGRAPGLRPAPARAPAP